MCLDLPRERYKAYTFSIDKSGVKLPPSAAIESYAKAFKTTVIGPTLLQPTPDLVKPFNPGHPVFAVLPARKRCTNWPSALISELMNTENGCELPPMSQEVYKYTQDDSDDNDDADNRFDWEERFRNDSCALRKHVEDDGGGAAALIPLCKELMGSVEKSKFKLPEICAQMRSMIAGLNQQDDDDKKKLAPDDSMTLPLSTSRKKCKR
jgi:hypothetical protein